MRKNSLVPLLLKNSSTSLYLDIESGEFYEVKFDGALTNAFSGNQKANTFFLSLLLIYVIIPLSLLLLNQFVFQNRLISFVLSYLIGSAAGYFLTKLVLAEIREKTKVSLSKMEIVNVSKKAITNGRILNLTVIFCVIYSIIGSVISFNLSQSGFSKFLIYNGLSVFVIVIIIMSSHPNRMIKAGKILKKAIKAGKVA